MKETNKIFSVTCKNCGAAVGFDIPTQSYRCVYCGTVSTKKEVEATWKTLDAEDWKRVQREEELASCVSCGAKILFKKDEASEKCSFCGGNLVRGALKESEELPELIVPFVLTEDEAKERLRAWVKGQKNTKDTRRVQQNIKNLKGYYLPYRLIRGPLEGTACRDLRSKNYKYKGFLDYAVVNTSGQLDNQVLDAAEPFDLSELKPFEYAYIGGHRVKLGDIAPAEIQKRTYEEANERYRPHVEKALHNRDVAMHIESGEFMYIPILLPVYLVKVGSYLTVVNGQTGKVASDSSKKSRTSKLWLIEPTLLTVIATILGGYYFQFAAYPTTLMAVIAGLIFFSVYGDSRNGVLHRIIHTGKNSKASRQSGELILEEGKNVFQNAFPNIPAFYERNGEREIQVKLKFYTLGRLLSVFIRLGILVFLPALLAIIINQGIKGVAFQYGAAWYIVAGFITILYCTRGLRWDIFNHPVLYEVLPDGKKKLFGTWKSRHLSILSLFHLDTRQKRKELGGIWTGILAITIFILLGSTLAMIY